MKKLTLIKIVIILHLSCGKSTNQGRMKVERDGTTHGEYLLKCDRPQKTYTKSIDAALDGSVAKLNDIDRINLNASVKTEVIKLTQYSTQGLDLDLLIFRMCQMTNNRSLSSSQAQDIINTAIKTWNGKMSVNEQKAVVNQLNTELEANLKSANELKKNTETILSSLNLISGDQILRNENIKVLPLLFPKSNLDKNQTISPKELLDISLQEYLNQKLSENSLEQQKFTAVAKQIALSLDNTIPTLNSLADKDGNRYQIYSNVWNANSSSLSKIEIFDITKFQKTYSELNSLKTNYNIVINRALDYLTNLNSFFKPTDNKIKREDIEKILTTERFAYEIISSYSESLVENINNLKSLQLSVNESLK